MKSLSSVGLGLSIVFGCLLLALVAELYYLLWWKRKFTNREIGDDYSSPARELFYMFCWRKLSSSSLKRSHEVCSSVMIADTIVHQDQESQPQESAGKDSLFKQFGEDRMETELLRLQSLSGPPRFLCTIIEETKEDLESEDGKSRCDNKSSKRSRSRSLSDLLPPVDTPYLTPLASPPFFTPPLTPIDSIYSERGFSYLSESPPPKFKFLQHAEEKLYRRKLLEDTEEDVQKNDEFVQHQATKATTSNFIKDEEDGPFITITVGKYKD